MSNNQDVLPNVAGTKWLGKLDSFRAMQDGWDSYSAPRPNSEALANARFFLERLGQSNTDPSRLAPSVVSGVGLTFQKAALKVYVEFSNKGSVHALFSDGGTDPKVDKVGLDDADVADLITKINSYLHE